jgi:hypothetical protein
MYEDSKKYLVGQPVFKQILNLIPKDKFNELGSHQRQKVVRKKNKVPK